MPVLLSARAIVRPPVPLLTAGEARALRIDVSSREYARVRPGIHASSAGVSRLAPWERYALRVHAFELACPGATMCLESAAVLHGLPSFGECRDIHVFAAHRSASRRFGDVSVHTSVDPREVVEIAGVRVTSLLDTVVDLARALPPAQALAVLDAATSPAQGGAVTRDEVRQRATQRADQRGARQLAWVLDTADPLAESPGESVSRAVILWSGFEVPLLQQDFHYEGVHDRVDFLFPSNGAIGESDGWGKYDLADPEAAKRHLTNEKRREDRLRRNRHPFGRWDYAGAVRVGPLTEALESAQVRRVGAPDRARLATLQRTPRSRGR